MSRWHLSPTELFQDILRGTAGLFIIVNGILLAMFSVYVLALGLWRLSGWLWRHAFSFAW